MATRFNPTTLGPVGPRCWANASKSCFAIEALQNLGQDSVAEGQRLAAENWSSFSVRAVIVPPSCKVSLPRNLLSGILRLRYPALRDFLLMKLVFVTVIAGCFAWGADLPGSKDPAGMKRYEGSEIIGYRQAKFEEYLLPLARQVNYAPAAYQKSKKVEGLVSRYTYLAPQGRTPSEVMQNYKLEFKRLGLATLYEKGANDEGWFGPTFDEIQKEDDLGQILSYNESQERLLVGQSKDAQPTYYEIFVTSYKDGIIPPRLSHAVAKDRTMAEIIVISPQKLDQKMVFVNADEMKRSIADTGRVALYGLYFDTDKDIMREDSARTMAEIAKLMKSAPQLKLRVVGHTDNQGAPAHNVDLSKRRAAGVVQQLGSKYGIAAARLDSFGAGQYAPVASNQTEDGRAKNRRVELVEW